MDTEWRRFKPLKEDISEFNRLVDDKGLTKEDLEVILTSIRLSEAREKQLQQKKVSTTDQDR